MKKNRKTNALRVILIAIALIGAAVTICDGVRMLGGERTLQYAWNGCYMFIYLPLLIHMFTSEERRAA